MKTAYIPTPAEVAEWKRLDRYSTAGVVVSAVLLVVFALLGFKYSMVPQAAVMAFNAYQLGTRAGLRKAAKLT